MVYFQKPTEHYSPQKLLLSPIGPLLSRLTGYKEFCNKFNSVFGPETKPSEKELSEFWEIINTNNGKHIFHNLITCMRDRIEHRERWVSALQTANIPLALINGSVDPVSGQHMVARYKELNCRLDYLAELPNIGHYPQVEAPSQVVEHYHRLLDLTTGQLQGQSKNSTAGKTSMAEKKPSTFERYLSIWVLLCIAGGILLGKVAPQVATTLDNFSIYQVSIPIAACLFFMMYPIMVNSSRRHDWSVQSF